MRRVSASAVVLAVILAAALTTSCARPVTVRTGVRYVCTYGETVSVDVRTIQVPEADAGKYSVVTKVVTCDRHKRAEALYALAQKAIASGDLAAARAQLAATLKLDPNFRLAPQQIAAIEKGGKPSPDASQPSTRSPSIAPPPDPAKPPTGGSGGSMDQYREIVPDEIAGFRAETLVAEDLTLTRDYVPGSTARYDQLVIMVQQYPSATAAAKAIDTVMVPAYSGSPHRGATAAGLKGYFGVNGQRFAALSLVRGTALLTFEFHATGASPAGLEKDLSAIAVEVLD